MAQHIGINMWSGPRNVSTALMYSFAQRSDTKVVDEPFYAHYLIQSGAEHPGREKVLDSQPKDSSIIIKNLVAAKKKHPVLFLKNMAHHMINMDEELDKLINHFRHIFLIRDPKEMLPSLDETLPNPTIQDTAYEQQLELFKKVKAKGLSLNVIDSRELLKDPEYVLSVLCERLEISFDQSMLTWEKGPIPEDGVWAEYWYDSVHESRGFKPYSPKEDELPDRLKPLYDDCKPIYDTLFAHAIKSNS